MAMEFLASGSFAIDGSPWERLMQQPLQARVEHARCGSSYLYGLR
jgi:hypothetical protein